MQSKGEKGIKVLSWEIGNSVASNSKHLLSQFLWIKSILAGWFCLSISHETVVSMSTRIWLGAGGSISTMACSYDCWLEASVPHHTCLSTGLPGCLQDLLGNQWFGREEGRSHDAFPDLATEVTLHHFHSILLLHWSALFHMGGDHIKTPGGRDHWWSSWRLATTVDKKPSKH